jgi:uncharacterized protein DUF4189
MRGIYMMKGRINMKNVMRRAAMPALFLLMTSFLPLYAVGAGPYGALAIDEADGTFYGWSHSYASQNEANAHALEECEKIGGECRVVLGFGGSSRCAAYRTVEGDVGTAYGWGRAASSEAADSIALSECRGRSQGDTCSRQVWACNASAANYSSAPAPRVEPESPPVNNETIKRKVIEYYNNQGEWAGQFEIAEVERLRLDDRGEAIIAHVRYRYRPVSGNSRQAGNDQRRFTLVRRGSSYIVTQMGDYMSASF